MILEGSFDSLTAYCEIPACLGVLEFNIDHTSFKHFAISLYFQVFLIPHMRVEKIKEILWIC